ncbi:E1 ubiquitin-activating protein uba2, partial [Linderina macrospora]
MRRTDQLAQLYGEEAAERISNARLLVVGAGGIGCELLKNLCMSGFQHIEVVDLDTIDLSNLNRQFLFQRKHIKRPKAEVAVQAICEFNPGIDAHAQQANIKDTRFDVDWFSQFDLVLNALDNLDARRHVNIKCLAAGVPLIESGTAGYLGHSTVIKGGETECFDCQEKPLEQKTFPVCTIRSTPTAPIHCIVWAKDYLFAQLFGEQTNKEGAEMEVDDEEDNMEELERLKEEAKALEILSKAVGKPDFAWQIFNKVFVQDIDRLLSMEDMWRNRVPPVRLSFEQLEAAAGKDFDATTFDDQKTLGAPEALALFCHSANWLARRATQDSERSPLAFDKDDQDALEFVAAAANLRAHAFGIEPKSIFA